MPDMLFSGHLYCVPIKTSRLIFFITASANADRYSQVAQLSQRPRDARVTSIRKIAKCNF